MVSHEGNDSMSRLDARQSPQAREDQGLPAAVPLRVVNANALFQGEREIYILLDGVRYWLRSTRRNRLILQK